MTDTMLYITWNPSLDAFHIGSLSFRWYSLCWLIGLALAYIVVKKLFKDQKIPGEKFDPLFIYCFLGILIGARLGHCIFYQPEDYLTSVKGFIEMLLPIHFTSPDGWDWKLTGYEGLASHGGTLGLMLALWLYVRRFKVPLWQVLDNIAIATGITACFIRLGNLMNSEIIGNVTTVPWAFEFVQRDGLPRHPAQLYEALAYLALFIFMLWHYKKNRLQPLTTGKDTDAPSAKKQQQGSATPTSQGETRRGLVGTGFYFGLCLTWIFTFRFFVEFLKKNQVDFENNMPLDMGQLLSIPFAILGAWCMYRALRRSA